LGTLYIGYNFDECCVTTKGRLRKNTARRTSEYVNSIA